LEERGSPVPPALEARKVSKLFGGTLALSGADLVLWPGEIHALVGENGAGKSTLTKILSGVYQPDTGEIMLDGRRVTFSTAAAAQASGVAIIFQEPTLFPDLTVAENVYVGHQPKLHGGLGIDRGAMRQGASQLIENLGLKIDVSRVLAGLSVAELQTVEMAAALTRRSSVLIVDEPTASLTPAEVRDLFAVLTKLKGDGVAVLFIGHRLEEVFAIADRISVLRDGESVSTGPTEEYTPERVIREMVGRSVEVLPRDKHLSLGEADGDVLSVNSIASGTAFRDVSFHLTAGSIVGLAGLVGAGRTEIAEAIVGIRRVTAGSILMSGELVHIRSPKVAQEHGISYVPEDRLKNGVGVDFSIAANVTLPILSRLSRWGFISRTQEASIADEWIRTLSIRSRGRQQLAGELSGGNQQKVVLAKCLAEKPSVLILDEPTRGVDVGAKSEIHGLIDALVQQGTAVLLISSDLPEILALSDRIVVIADGTQAGVLPGDASAEQVMAMAIGSRDISLAPSTMGES
jgi:rhamnose transport system ATP-binding protein